MIRIVILLLGSLMSVSAFSQKVKVSSSLDTSAIMIGQQFRMNLKVEQPANVVVVWPVWKDTVAKGVEIVETTKTDTIFSENKEKITFKKDYILTVFDSGYYRIPAFAFAATNGNKTDSIFTNPLFVRVERPEVDTTQAIRDIKSALEIPFDWREYLPHILIGFSAVGLIALGVFFLLRYIRKRREAQANVPVYVEPPLPPSARALNALHELEEKQLWQRGKNKEYFTELTDILRDYIRDIYQVNAPEMLTDEILQHLKFKEIEGGARQTLKAILELADMVKFAKVIPTTTENQESLNSAKRFVEETAPVIKPKKEEEKGGAHDH